MNEGVWIVDGEGKNVIVVEADVVATACSGDSSCQRGLAALARPMEHNHP